MSPTLDDLYLEALAVEEARVKTAIREQERIIDQEYRDSEGDDEGPCCPRCGEPCMDCADEGDADIWAETDEATERAKKANAKLVELRHEQRQLAFRRKAFAAPLERENEAVSA